MVLTKKIRPAWAGWCQDCLRGKIYTLCKFMFSKISFHCNRKSFIIK